MKKLKYIVVMEEEFWGKSFEGVPIIGPAELALNGRREKIVVLNLVPQFYNSIQKFLNKHGIYDLVPLNMVNPYCLNAKDFENIMLAGEPPDVKKKDKSKTEAILVRGLFDGFFTPLVLKHLRIQYPKHYIVLSTWDYTPEELLRKIDVDKIILNGPPEDGGLQNRNNQIVCAKSGLEWLKEQGFQEVFIQRTDQIIFRDNVINRCKDLLDKYPNKAGFLTKRIVIMDAYTRKYLFYHPGDMVMYGDIDDLYAFWDCSFDHRKYEDFPIEPMDKLLKKRNLTKEDLLQYSKSGWAVECLYCKNLLDKVGYKYNYTQEDWDFVLANFFILREINWWKFYWHKPTVFTDNRWSFSREPFPLECVDEVEWEDLYQKYAIKE